MGKSESDAPAGARRGYLWSPKRNANGAKNPFYETMREVSPGDVVFAFVDTVIVAIGVAKSYCSESPKPSEFGTTGEYWEGIGWKIRVQFIPLIHRMRPKDHMGVLRPLLPSRYSPLQANGNGIQSIYLTEFPPPLAETLAGLIGPEAQSLIGSVSVGAPIQTNDDLDYWEHKIEVDIERDTAIPPADRVDIIRARRGQGIFKQHRTTLPHHGCHQPSPFDREPLQAVARLEQRRAIERRERTTADAKY